MKNCNLHNPCSGVYGKCLDVKITSLCNGRCDFCIEKGGYDPDSENVKVLIAATNSLEDYKTVLILGGEPFLYPYLAKYVKGLENKKIYITTNGSINPEILNKDFYKKLSGLNISLHYYTEKINAAITGVNLNYNLLSLYINKLLENGVPVRINCNLLNTGINTFSKALKMAHLAKKLGATSIRFSELQNCPTLFQSAYDIFDIKVKDPFSEGCEIKIEGFPLPVIVRLTCGRVNPVRPKPKGIRKRLSLTKVMYPDGKIYDGWIAKSKVNEDYFSSSCHGEGQ